MSEGRGERRDDIGGEGYEDNVFGQHFWAFTGEKACTATAFGVPISASRRVDYHQPCILIGN